MKNLNDESIAMDLTKGKKFNILIVDDNPKNIQVIGNILREANYLTGFAMEGQQALTLLEKNSDYDLILLDIEMPVMNGYETCIAIRKDEKLKEIPVIFLTAFTDVSNIVRGFESGAQDYITKPFNAQELLARVSTHLQLKSKTDTIRNLNMALEQKVSERTAELQKALSEVNSLDALKTEFLIFIGQEIRIPLDGIIGTLNLIKNQEHSTSLRNLFETLERSVARLEEFTYKALFFNQINQSKYAAQITDLSLKDIVQFVILEFTDRAREKYITIKTDNLDRNFFIKGDRDLLFKAFSYILDNSIKHGIYKGHIDIGFEITDENVICSFTDSGDGFPAEVIKQLSQPFRFNEGNSFQQTSLSLHIVKHIMELHSGVMLLENTAGGNAQVRLLFKK